MIFRRSKSSIGSRVKIFYVEKREIVDPFGNIFADNVRIIRDGIEKTAFIQPKPDRNMVFSDGEHGIEPSFFKTRRRKRRELQHGSRFFFDDGAGTRSAHGHGEIAVPVLFDRIGFKRRKNRRGDLAHVILPAPV